MVSVHCCSSRPFQVVHKGFHPPLHIPQPSFITFHAPTSDAFPAHFNFRFNTAVSVQLRQRILPIPRSSTKPSGGSDQNNDASGPPLATILAGLLVFCVVGWIVGSIVMWIISLITNFPPSK